MHLHFAISSETERHTAAKFCTETHHPCRTCVTHGLGLMLLGVVIGAASSTVSCGWLDNGHE